MKQFLEMERKMRGMWESCEGASDRTYFEQLLVISDVTMICENVTGDPHATELIQMVFFM